MLVINGEVKKNIEVSYTRLTDNLREVICLREIMYHKEPSLLKSLPKWEDHALYCGFGVKLVQFYQVVSLEGGTTQGKVLKLNFW